VCCRPARLDADTAQMPATEGMALLPGVKLCYWIRADRGEPILLCHPATGSALNWGYQQPCLPGGYRVIGYSRRGFTRPKVVRLSKPLRRGRYDALLNHLKAEKFHMIGAAAGGFSLADYANPT